MIALLVSLLVRAETLERVYAKRLARARPGQVVSLVAEFDRLRELRLACKLELRENRFPSACFATLGLEDLWGLRSRADRARVSMKLEAKCVRAARALILPASATDLSMLSPACRRHVREGRKIRAYRDEDGIGTREPWSGS